MKYALHMGGRGHYAHVKLRLLGAPRGKDYVFVNCITGGSIPSEFIESVEAGIREALSRGIVAGYPTDGVQVELYDGSYHDVDSTKETFRIAGFLAARDAVQKAAPVLIEPVMLLEVTVPEDQVADVMGNIVGRRGVIDSRQDRDGTCVIQARVPLAELFGYTTDLRARTFGRGAFKTRFYRYQPRRMAGGEADGRESIVGAPLKPKPNLRVSGVALPELREAPDDDQDDGLLSV
jgi:elongation factor G